MEIGLRVDVGVDAEHIDVANQLRLTFDYLRHPSVTSCLMGELPSLALKENWISEFATVPRNDDRT